jgi:hypothetical protein
MLRLVHPAPKGQVSSRPKGFKSPALFPTKEERLRIRAAIRNAARAYGGYDVLSSVTGLPIETLQRAGRQTSFGVAVIIARAAGIPVEQVLTGKPHEAGSCALCGRKGAR